MAIDEVSNLKTEILFGSSHCSCTSCDTVRCFTKRNFNEDACLCPLCNEPTTCMYNVKNLPVKVGMKASPSKESQRRNKQVKVSHSPNRKKSARRNARDNRSIINIKVIKKNVYIQTQPQDFADDATKSQSREDLPQDQNEGASNPLANIINKLLANYNNVSIQNVVDRIAEIYTTCTCKVCDCMFSNRNTQCDCKPCECVDCKSALMPAIDNTTTYTCKNMSSQPFRYENQAYNDELISIKENDPCDCKPCDCDECNIYNINIKDDAQLHNFNISMSPKLKKGRIPERDLSICSYQCAKCRTALKPSKKVIVAPVTQYPQVDACSCSPCDCSNCRLHRSPVSARGMREISTGMMQNLNCKCTQCSNQSCRQTTGSCHCESRNSVINKPFDNNDQNIDIHSALISKKTSKQSCVVSALTDVILGLIEENVKKINYDCYTDNLTSENRNGACPSISTSLCRVQNLSSYRVNNGRISQCTCSPCECKICDHFKIKGPGVWKSEVFRSKCDCEICRCLYCGDLLQFRDVLDNNKIDQMSTNTCKVNKSTKNRDRSVYLALLHDVYRINTYSLKGNKCAVQNYLFSDKATKTQNASNRLLNNLNENNPSSFDSGNSTERNTSTKHETYLPENQSHESSYKCFSNYQEVLKNKVIETFVGKVDLNFDVEIPTSCPSSEKEILNKGESILFFPETLDTRSKYSTANKNKDNWSKKKLNESFGDSIAYKEHENTKPKTKIGKNNKFVRESFGKTNLASKNDNYELHNNKTKSISKVITTTDFKLNGVINEVKDKESLPIPENYLQKRNILFKAKLLTYELIKMLYQCQKAHNEFKRVRENLKNNSDSNTRIDDSMHRKIMEPCEIHISNLDFKCSLTNVANTNDKPEAVSKKEDDSKGNIILNKKSNFSDIVKNIEIKQSRSTSKFNIHVDFVKNKNSELVPKKIVTNEFSDAHNTIKCESHLTTIFKKTGSNSKSKNSSAELNHLCYNAWKINKRNEISNYNKIKYIDINNMDKKELCNKKRYILIENITARPKDYKSQIKEHY